MKVIVPVAGIGSRLRPHTHTAPKALLHVAGKPLLGHILDSLKSLRFSEISFVTGFMGEKIVEFVRHNYNFNARFVAQEELLGLGYAVDLALNGDEREELLIILGDTIVETDWTAFTGQGKNLLGVKPVGDPRRFGVAEVQGDRILKLWEKPENPPSNLALVGVYYIKDARLLKKALSRMMAENIKTRNEYQITDALQLMLEEGANLHTYPIEGWFDCGKQETLLATNRHLLDNCRTCRPDIEGSVIIPPVFIDATAVIENSIIGPYTSIAPQARISQSIITNSIISCGANVRKCLLKDSLVGDNAVVKGNQSRLNVGDSSEIDY